MVLDCSTSTCFISAAVVSFKLNGGSSYTVQVTENDGSLEVDIVLSKPVDQEVYISVLATGLTAIGLLTLFCIMAVLIRCLFS